MAELIAKAQSGSANNYAAALAQVARMQDDLVFPDITVVARNAWVAHSAKVVSAKPDSTLSRTFLANVSLK
jgi:peptide/nickel transport system substrate-binding protein